MFRPTPAEKGTVHHYREVACPGWLAFYVNLSSDSLRGGVVTFVQQPMPTRLRGLIGDTGTQGAKESVHASGRGVFVYRLEGFDERLLAPPEREIPEPLQEGCRERRDTNLAEEITSQLLSLPEKDGIAWQGLRWRNRFLAAFRQG